MTAPLAGTPTALSHAAQSLRAHGFEFYLVSRTTILKQLDHAPLGVPVTPLHFLQPDSNDWHTADFIRLFHSMNTHAFRARELPMPPWVMVDHGLLSSAFMIIACEREALAELARDPSWSERQREVVANLIAEAGQLGFDGPIPVAAYCAAPTADRDRWTGWSLCSVLPRRGLAFVAKGLGLGAYRTRFLDGVTQYDNSALRIHTQFGRLRIRAAVVDLHSAPHSLLYETDVVRWSQEDADHDAEEQPTWLVGATDAAKHAEMHEMIYSGTHVLFILPPGLIVDGSQTLVPVLAKTAPGR